MDTEQEQKNGEPSPTDAGKAAVINEETAERDRETGKTVSPAGERSRPDFRSVGCLVVVLAIVLFFAWIIVSAIVDVAKEDREREMRRRQNLYSYHSSTQRASSGRSSGSSSSGSSYGSSGSTYKPKQSSGTDRKDEYNAADFGNPEDFYDEHYDDFFDYYDAEDYWNEYN